MDATFAGFQQSNTTPVPDVLFDELLTEMSGSELKIIMYIIRRTAGFKKTSDGISLSQFAHGITTKEGRVLDKGCGITDHKNLRKLLSSLEERGFIERIRGKASNGACAPTEYRLRFMDSTLRVGGKKPLGVGGEIPPGVEGKKPPRVGGEIPPHKKQNARNSEQERMHAISAQSTDQEDHSINHSVALSSEEMILALQAQGYIVTPPEISANKNLLTSEPEQGTPTPDTELEATEPETIPTPSTSKSVEKPLTLSPRAQAVYLEHCKDPTHHGVVPDLTASDAEVYEFLAQYDPLPTLTDLIKARDVYKAKYTQIKGWHVANYRKAYKYYLSTKDDEKLITTQRPKRSETPRPQSPEERARTPITF